MFREQQYKDFKWRLTRPTRYNYLLIGIGWFVSPDWFPLTANDVDNLIRGEKNQATIHKEIRSIIDKHLHAHQKP